MRVGFVGVGRLGGHLAASLVRAGFSLVVHDLDRRAAGGLEASGARWADSCAELARSVDVVITCLPSPSAVASALEADDGVLAGLASGSTWIDMSTNDRRELLRLAEAAAEVGMRDARGTRHRRRSPCGDG